MPATITVLAPYLAPTLTGASTLTGGSCPAGNYQFIIFNTYSTTSTFPQRWSPPSNIISISSVPANSKIVINWTKNDAGSTYFYGLYNYNDQGWLPVIHYGTINSGTFTMLSNITYQYASCYWLNTTINTRIYGLSNTRGIGQINITGSGNFTMTDIKNAIINSGAVAGEDYINMGASALIANYCIDARTYGTGSLDLSANFIYLAGGFSNVGSSLTLWGTTITLSTYTYGIVGTACGFYFANCNILDKVNTVITSLTPPIYNWYGVGAALTISSGSVKNLICNYFNLIGVQYVSSSVLKGSMTLFNNCSDLSFTFPQAYSLDNDWTIKRCKFLIRSSYTLLYNPSAGKTYTFLDCDFYDQANDVIKLTNDQIFGVNSYYIYGYSNASLTLASRINIKKTVQFNISNQINQNVSSATITLKDRYGNVALTGVTNSSGYFTGEIFTYASQAKFNCPIRYPNSVASACDNYDFNPFTITVTKAGYQDYSDVVRIDEQKTFDIALLIVPLKISSVSQTHASLPGTSDGTITVQATGGTQPYQFSKDNGVTWQSSGSFTGLAPGSYNIKVKDADNTITQAFVVEIVAPDLLYREMSGNQLVTVIM